MECVHTGQYDDGVELSNDFYVERVLAADCAGSIFVRVEFLLVNVKTAGRFCSIKDRMNLSEWPSLPIK